MEIVGQKAFGQRRNLEIKGSVMSGSAIKYVKTKFRWIASQHDLI
jgi:hypothetical protein